MYFKRRQTLVVQMAVTSVLSLKKLKDRMIKVFKMHPLHCAKVQRCLNNYFPIRQAHSYFRSLLGESTVDMLQPKLASK